MSPRADRRRRLAGATGLLVSGLLVAGTATGLAGTGLAGTGLAGTPTGSGGIVTGGESWAPELALEGGDDRGVLLADGGVRPVPAAGAGAGAGAEGVLIVAPRHLLRPSSEVTGTVTSELPAGTGVELQVRALDGRGSWGSWQTVPDRSPARFGSPTSEVQVRLLLHGAPDGSAVPTARGAWLTAVPTPQAARTGASTGTSIAARTGTATTAAPVPAAGLVWDGSIATKGLGGFKDTPYNVTGDATVRVVDGPPRSIRITVPGGSQRAEIEPDVDEFGEGETRYFRLTYTLPASFPVTPSGFQLASQWKNDGTGSPPLELRIEDGKFRLGGGFGRPGGSRLFATDIAPVITGRPVDIVVGIVFSSDPGRGRVDVWLDGRQRVAGFRPPGGTLYPGARSYWKVGLYRDTGDAGTATADLTVARLGETYESVAGAAPEPTTTSSPTTSPPRTSTPSRPTSPTPTVIATTPPRP